MSATVAVAIVLAFAAAYAMLRIWPDRTRRVVRWIRRFQRAILVLVAVSFIVLFLSTGSPLFVGLGFVLALLGAVEVLSSDRVQDLLP